jgi:transposase
VPKPAPRPPRGSKLGSYKEYITNLVSSGVDNCVVLLRELRERGYEGSYTILKDFTKSLRKRPGGKQTVRYETEPSEQAQVDFGSFKYTGVDGKTHRMWAFVMVLSWSRAIYAEFIKKADLATSMRAVTSMHSSILAALHASASTATRR